MDSRWSALRSLARRQHGVFSLGQAVESGYSRDAVRHRVLGKTWDELDVRAYRVATGVPPMPTQLVMAGTLATAGVAYAQSAAALYGLVPFPDAVHLVVPRTRKSIRRAGLHSSRALDPVDITTVDGVPATTPARTLIDLAGFMSAERFEDVLDRAIVCRLVRADRLESRARALWTPRRRGCAVVLTLLASRHPDLARARSSMEARVLRTLDRCGVLRPRVNYRVRSGGRTRYLDFAWPDRKVALEFDGFVPHSTRQVFDDDRVRQNELVADGWTIFRITKTALDHDEHAALAPVLAVLAKA